MEHQLRQHMIAVARAFAEAEDCGLSTVSRRCRNDSGFFRRIEDPAKSFTARTYDEVIDWFRNRWPLHKDWPTDQHFNAACTPTPGDTAARVAGSFPDPTPGTAGSQQPSERQTSVTSREAEA